MNIWEQLARMQEEMEVRSRVRKLIEADVAPGVPSQRSKKPVQLAVTKDDKLRIIDSIGRVVCEIPMSVVKKYGGPAGAEIIRREVPQWQHEAMGSGNSTSQGDDGGPEETEVERTY